MCMNSRVVLIVCAVVAIALALRVINKVPDVVDGLLFGVALGLLTVLYIKRDIVRLF